MSGFDGKAFMLGIQHLDAASKELFELHGKALDGRWTLAEQILDDAMLRLVGSDLRVDTHGSHKLR